MKIEPIRVNYLKAIKIWMGRVIGNINVFYEVPPVSVSYHSSDTFLMKTRTHIKQIDFNFSLKKCNCEQ